jgi:hypothetical protein
MAANAARLDRTTSRLSATLQRIRRGMSIWPGPVCLKRDDPDQDDATKYMLLIHHGDTLTARDQEAWAPV